MEHLDLESQISALPPVVLGGFVVVPIGLIAKVTDQPLPKAAHVADTQPSAARARNFLLDVERRLGVYIQVRWAMPFKQMRSGFGPGALLQSADLSRKKRSRV